MFILQSTLCFSSINLMFISNYTVFFMQMTARLFIIMHINSRLYAYLFLSLLIYQKIEIAKIGK